MRKGFTLVELLVVIAVCATILAIAMPALAGARRASRNARCLSNLHQIATSAMVYADEHRRLPVWDDVPEVADLRCPRAPMLENDQGGYTMPVGFGVGGMGTASARDWYGNILSQDPGKVIVVSCWRHTTAQCGYFDGHAH